MRYSKTLWILLFLIGICIPVLPSATQLDAKATLAPASPLRPASAKIADHLWESFQTQDTAEALVILTSQADLSAAARLETVDAKGYFVYHTLYATAQRTQAPLRAWLDARQVPYRSYYIINALWIDAEQATMLALAKRADVERIVANPRIAQTLDVDGPMTSVPASPDSVEWGISQIGAPSVWNLGYTGEGIVIAGQDTGYDWDHPALINTYRGWDGQQGDHDYNWHDAIHVTTHNSSCGVDSPEPCDDYGHGTHTMGTMVGDDGSTNQVGVAPGAQWISCRNMDEGYGTPVRYIECFEFFVAPYPVNGTPADGNPSKAPDLINNSWSCPASEGCDWASLQATVDAVHAAGIMIISSASNYGSSCSTVREPASLYANVYSIGATDSSDTIASFSSRGPVTVDGSGRLKPELSAPGVSVRSTVPGGGYGYKQGTSMASPHVAGAVALLWSAVPTMHGNIPSTEAVLNSYAVPRYSTQCGDPANTVPNNVYGWGRLDVGSAVAATYQAGELDVTVKNELGMPVAGATLSLVRTDGASWQFVTDAAGHFSREIAVSQYMLTVSAPNYVSRYYPQINIALEQTTVLTPILPCGSPVAGTTFTTTPEVVRAEQPVRFTAGSTQGATPIIYTWRFNDTAEVVIGNPVTHVFSLTETAIIPVPVSVTGMNMCSQQTVTQVVEVHNTYPSCDSIEGLTQAYTPTVLHAQQPATFTASVMTGTLPVTYTWQFGDGGIPVVGNPVTHTFPADATEVISYVVTVTAVNTCSQQGVTQTVQVHNPYTPCDHIQGLTMAYTPTVLYAQQPATFSTTMVTGTLPVTYTWQFGDGGTPVVGNPVTYTYPTDTAEITSYVVTVTASNACSQQIVTRTIQVHNYLTSCASLAGLTFAYQPQVLYPGHGVTLTADVSSGTPPVTYTWLLNNNLALHGNPVTYTVPIFSSQWQPQTMAVTASNACSTLSYAAELPVMLARMYLPLIIREAGTQ